MGMFRRLSGCLACWVLCILALTPIVCNSVLADSSTPDEGFSLQVSPSPLVATIQPGQTSSLVLHIRNTNSDTQNLVMGLRSFSVDATTGQIKFGAVTPSDIARFVSFSAPSFSLEAGQIYDQQVMIRTPADAGFTYSFAITIAQAHPPKAQGGKTAIQGSVAVFTLLSVDRPGAVRKLTLNQLSVSKHVYEYLPAAVTVKLTNAGNTLAQPSGTIFIQRSTEDTQPLATIPLNKNGGYILPGTSRSLTASWNDGFPHYITTSSAGASPKTQLSWAGGDFTKFRFGRYVAKVVAVYNDGSHDVPLTASVSFWVIPWRLLLVLLVILALLITGFVTTLHRSSRVIRQKARKHETPKT